MNLFKKVNGKGNSYSYTVNVSKLEVQSLGWETEGKIEVEKEVDLINNCIIIRKVNV